MRDPIDSKRIREVLKELGRELRSPATVYLTGGTSAVLEGWRDSTADCDFKFVPDGEVYGVLPRLKEKLRVNIELASPDHFLPPLPGWEGRCPFIAKFGCVEFRHFDFYSQALAKIERGFDRDLADAREMVQRKLVDPDELARMAREILPQMNRYPAVDPGVFLRAVDDFIEGLRNR